MSTTQPSFFVDTMVRPSSPQGTSCLLFPLFSFRAICTPLAVAMNCQSSLHSMPHENNDNQWGTASTSSRTPKYCFPRLFFLFPLPIAFAALNIVCFGVHVLMCGCESVCSCEYRHERFLLSSDDPAFFCLGYQLEDGSRSDIATILVYVFHI